MSSKGPHCKGLKARACKSDDLCAYYKAFDRANGSKVKAHCHGKRASSRSRSRSRSRSTSRGPAKKKRAGAYQLLVRKVMRENGLSLVEAAKHIKAHGLHTPKTRKAGAAARSRSRSRSHSRSRASAGRGRSGVKPIHLHFGSLGGVSGQYGSDSESDHEAVTDESDGEY